jgi:hypothetical protein
MNPQESKTQAQRPICNTMFFATRETGRHNVIAGATDHKQIPMRSNQQLNVYLLVLAIRNCSA